MKALPQCTMVEGLRSLVGDNVWDYCILWKLSPDQRFLEWMGCCCCGTEASIENGGGLFPGGSSAQKTPCRDLMFKHPRTRACDALSEFPSSIPLDSSSGITISNYLQSFAYRTYAQVLISNQPTWQTNLPDSTSSHVTGRDKTRVLIPIPGGLVELFVSKHITEDQNIVDFVMSQCNSSSYEQAQAMPVSDFLDHQQPDQDLEGCDYTAKNNHHEAAAADLNPWIPPQTMMPGDHPSFSWDLTSADQSQLYTSPLNLFDGAKNGGDVFFEGSIPPPPLDSTVDNGAHDMAEAAYQQSLMTTARCLHQSAFAESSVSREVLAGHEKDSVKQEAGRADSASEGSDEEEEARPMGRNGKRHHSKNLVAERKRRKKLNDRLYALRALVPKITKMDRASILGDAIEYVMELQKQVKDLQDELEETNPEDDDAKQIGSNCKLEIPNPNGMSQGMEIDESPNNSKMVAANTKTADPMKQGPEPLSNDDKGQQMEPQVEVRQVEGNEFFLKVFCEHKIGGFARLMEAMSSLGLEVTNANVTTFRGLVLNVFRVEKRDNEGVQVDQVRDSLLELTRNANRGWSEPEQTVANGGGDYHHDDHRYRSHHHHHHLNSHHELHYLHHQP